MKKFLITLICLCIVGGIPANVAAGAATNAVKGLQTLGRNADDVARAAAAREATQRAAAKEFEIASKAKATKNSTLAVPAVTPPKPLDNPKNLTIPNTDSIPRGAALKESTKLTDRNAFVTAKRQKKQSITEADNHLSPDKKLSTTRNRSAVETSPRTQTNKPIEQQPGTLNAQKDRIARSIDRKATPKQKREVGAAVQSVEQQSGAAQARTSKQLADKKFVNEQWQNKLALIKKDQQTKVATKKKDQLNKSVQRRQYLLTKRQAVATKRGLGQNPFQGKTPQQIDKMFRDKGFDAKGTDPVAGKGSYINPETGRKYYIDKGGKYKKGTELPHVDVHRPSSSSLPKKKLPLGDQLTE